MFLIITAFIGIVFYLKRKVSLVCILNTFVAIQI